MPTTIRPFAGKRICTNLLTCCSSKTSRRVSAISRDLAMIKVTATHGARSHVLELANVFVARVVDVGPESLTIEITGPEAKIDGLLEVLRLYGIRLKWCAPE